MVDFRATFQRAVDDASEGRYHRAGRSYELLLRAIDSGGTGLGEGERSVAVRSIALISRKCSTDLGFISMPLPCSTADWTCSPRPLDGRLDGRPR